MTISTEEVRRVAALAELDVPETQVARLAGELDAIVAYVGQLEAVTQDSTVERFVAGPSSAPLRNDGVAPAPLLHQIDTFAPLFRDGFFLVPKLAGMEGE